MKIEMGMKGRRIVLLGLFAASVGLLLSSCKEEPRKDFNKEVMCQSFIDNYCVPSSMQLLVDKGKASPVIRFFFDGDILHGGEKPDAAYSEVARKYNDLSYKQMKKPIYHNAYSKAIASIRLVALTDYNETYAAGADLTPIVLLETKSYYPFISSGYVIPEEAEEADKPYVVARKSPDEFAEEEMTLLLTGTGSVAPQIEFSLLPSVAEQRVRLEVRFEDDTEFQQEVELEFELPDEPEE